MPDAPISKVFPLNSAVLCRFVRVRGALIEQDGTVIQRDPTPLESAQLLSLSGAAGRGLDQPDANLL